MKTSLMKLFIVLLLFQAGILGLFSLGAANTYTATWASVDTHPAAPEWFQDAKLGLWYHWGVYSVPAYGSEWYPRNMYNTGSSEYNHHMATYGDPKGNWPYHNFINGANNKAGVYTKFAPKLKSQGGNFDPDEWAQLFVDAGAKMAGLVAEHHDGISLWNSTCNEWNSVKKGPGLDLTGLFATAYRAKGLKFLVSTHSAYNFTGYYQWVPAQSDNSLKKLYGQLSKSEEEQLWLNKEKELIDQYQPDYMWHDFNMGQVSEATRLNYLAYYYNKAIDWGKEVVVSYNDGFNTRGEVQQVERGGYANLTYPFWLSEDSISSSTWCYTQGMGYYPAKAVLHALIDRVSKNGCVLLDICPMADGTIPQAQKDILITMGNWLKVFGESVYATRAYTKYGEGPTAMGGGGMGAPREGKATDIRFTRNKANNVLYAIAMGWPSNNQMVITSFKSGSFDSSLITGITFLNGGGSCTWSQDSTGLKINLPSNLSNSMGYAVKIALSGSLSVNGATFYRDYDYAGSSIKLKPGNYTTAQLTAAGIPDNSVSSVRMDSGISVEIYDGDNFGGSKWTFTSDTANFGSAGCNDMMSSVKIMDTSSTPVPTPTPAPTPTVTPACALKGDVNGSGTVDIVDALIIAQAYVGLNPSGYKAVCADVNCDGSITIVDALMVAQYYVGLIPRFC